MNIVVENNSNDLVIKCSFCDRELERSEMVRYRGAISCRKCTEKQKPVSNPIMRPFVYLAGIGCLIGMLNFIYFTGHYTLYALLYPASYIQPLIPFFAGLTATVILLTAGLYAINRVHLFIGSIVSVLMGLLAAASSALALYDFIVTGPYYVIEGTIYTKTVSYYPTALATYSFFAIIAALAILLHMANTKTEYVSIAAAGLFLLSSSILMPVWIVSGFLNVLAYSVAFGFFVSRRAIYEEEPIQPL